MAVAAGVIAVMKLLTLVTKIYLAAQAFGAAIHHGQQRLFVYRWHSLAVFFKIGSPILFKNILD